ncbi:MAG: flagellar FlbD family protein [Acidimicrobiales bacterium]
MILLKRLTGSTLALNPDLMERVEANPDTVITMVDGKKVLVHETVQEVVDLVLEYRSEILRVAYREATSHPIDPTPPLRLIVGPDDTDDEAGAAAARRENN